MSANSRRYRAPRPDRRPASDWSMSDQQWLDEQPELDPWHDYEPADWSYYDWPAFRYDFSDLDLS